MSYNSIVSQKVILVCCSKIDKIILSKWNVFFDDKKVSGKDIRFFQKVTGCSTNVNYPFEKNHRIKRKRSIINTVFFWYFQIKYCNFLKIVNVSFWKCSDVRLLCKKVNFSYLFPKCVLQVLKNCFTLLLQKSQLF